MSKKRFTANVDYMNGGTIIKDNGKDMNVRQLIETLNGLNEENVKLKVENEGLSDTVDSLQELLTHINIEEEMS